MRLLYNRVSSKGLFGSKLTLLAQSIPRVFEKWKMDLLKFIFCISGAPVSSKTDSKRCFLSPKPPGLTASVLWWRTGGFFLLLRICQNNVKQPKVPHGSCPIWIALHRPPDPVGWHWSRTQCCQVPNCVLSWYFVSRQWKASREQLSRWEKNQWRKWASPVRSSSFHTVQVSFPQKREEEKISESSLPRFQKLPLLPPWLLERVFVLSYNLEMHICNWNKMFALNDENKKWSK